MSLIDDLAKILLSRDYMLSTAESCTGGLVAEMCTDKAGSSVWFDRGYVTYSNESKTDMLNVAKQLIERHGAVSQEVAEAMALGVINNSKAQCSISITGIAGPTGGSDTKPVGTVWIAWSINNNIQSQRFLLNGNRQQVRQQAAEEAIKGLIILIKKK